MQLSFKKWLEAVSASAVINYNDGRYTKSEDARIAQVMEALRSHVDPKRYEVCGHGLRGAQDIQRVFKLGLQAPNTNFGRVIFTIFEAGVPLEQQPREAFDTLIQWPFARRTNIILVGVPPENPQSVWREIRDDEEKSFLPTAIGGVKVTIDPQFILGCFDAAAVRFIPRT